MKNNSIVGFNVCQLARKCLGNVRLYVRVYVTK